MENTFGSGDDLRPCTDGGCIMGHPGGMHTNGGCQHLKGTYMDTRVLLRKLALEYRKLKKVVEQHDLCHDLHGKVDAEAFAKGCISEQKRIYGVSPTKDVLDEAISLLEDRVHSPESAWNEWMFRIDQFLTKHASNITKIE